MLLLHVLYTKLSLIKILSMISAFKERYLLLGRRAYASPCPPEARV
jgi:hypothetical protein